MNRPDPLTPSPERRAGRGSERAGATTRSRHSLSRAGALLAGIAVGALLGSCQTASNPEQGGPQFPAGKVQAETLEIQVVPDGAGVRLTNTTARKFGRSRLWLNRWFSRDVDGFGVGQTLSFHLSEFRDQYGEPLRAGGFFATRIPERVVQAQLETADSLIGLVVVAKGED